MKTAIASFMGDCVVMKPEKRKNAAFWAAVFSALYLLCSYASIALCGYERNYADAAGFLSAVPPYALTLAAAVVIETFRAMLQRLLSGQMSQAAASARTTFVTALAMLLAVTLLETAAEDTLSFVPETLIPVLLLSAMLTRLVRSGGVLPALLYIAATGLPTLLPICPDTTRFVGICLDILLPALFIVALDCDGQPETEKKTSKGGVAFNIAIIAAVALVVLFASGILPYRPVSIATGSMEPELSVGDMAIISVADRDNIEVGDIIKFSRGGVYVIHRVDGITQEDGQIVYITKGDANNGQDAGYVTADEIEGKVVGKIPTLGYFTLWLHSVG